MASGGGEEEGGGEDEPELKQVSHLLLSHPGATTEEGGGEGEGRESKGGTVSGGICMQCMHLDSGFQRYQASVTENYGTGIIC